MNKFQGSSLYLTPEGLRDQTGEIILTKREILDELVGPGAEAPLPEGGEQDCAAMLKEAVEIIEWCTGCDLIYGAHDQGLGIGQVLGGVTVTNETDMADIVKGFIEKYRCQPQDESRSSTKEK